MSRIRELIDDEMPNWQCHDEGTFDWKVDYVERFTSIIAEQIVRECIGVLNEEIEKCRQRVNEGEHYGIASPSRSYDIPAIGALTGGVSLIKKHVGLE